MSLLISYDCFYTFLGRLSLAPSLCHLSPFLLSYVAVSRPCCFMLEVYPNRSSKYSQTLLIWTSRGPQKMSVLTGCLY